MSNKNFEKPNNKFQYTELVNFKQLRNYAEQRFSTALRVWVDKRLETDPKALAYSIEEVRAQMILQTNAFQSDYRKYVKDENTDNYWNFKIAGNKVYIIRTDNNEKIAYIMVRTNEQYKFISTIIELLK